MANEISNQDSTQLLEAQSHLWNHIFNFVNSMSLKCAVQLGIPDIIHNHGKPMTLQELIKSLPIHPTKADCLPRLMRALVNSGFFGKVKIKENGQELDGYVLTNSSKLLVEENPLSLKPFLLSMLDPALTGPWQCMNTWFSNDDHTPFYTFHGRGIWDQAGHDPQLNSSFNEAMASDAKLVMSVMTKDSEGMFDGLKSLVDVGGGTGSVAKALANAFPHLNCTVFDLPHVVAGLPDTDNLKFVAGNMFDEIPPADAILLKWILHDWNDERCIKLLKNCREAIKGREGGKLVIIDMVMGTHQDNEESVETEHIMDIVVMVLYNSMERNEKEFAKLFFDAGFSSYKIIPMLGLRSVIEVYP